MPDPFTARAPVDIPGNATVPVAVRFADEKLPDMRALPWTESFWDGVVVPIPTFPPVVAKYAEPDEVIAVVEA